MIRMFLIIATEGQGVLEILLRGRQGESYTPAGRKRFLNAGIKCSENSQIWESPTLIMITN
jgi:hypothetical protein